MAGTAERNTIGMGLQAGSQALRFSWYFALKQAIDWQTSRLAPSPRSAQSAAERPSRPAPTEREILADLAGLFLRDAMAVRDGVFPPLTDAGSPLASLARAHRRPAPVTASAYRRLLRNLSREGYADHAPTVG